MRHEAGAKTGMIMTLWRDEADTASTPYHNASTPYHNAGALLV